MTESRLSAALVWKSCRLRRSPWVGAAPDLEIVVVQNFLADLKARMQQR